MLTSSGLESTQRSKHYGDNAGGGLYSTPSDLFKFIKGIEENKVLSKEYVDMMFQAHSETGEGEAEGYAWSIKAFGEDKIYFAAGSGYGTKSVIIRIPDSNSFIGITSNWGNTPILSLLRDLYLSIKGVEVKPPSKNSLASPDKFKEKLGQYKFKQEELTKHLGINNSYLRLHEFEGRLFLEDELLNEKEGFLLLSYTEELKIYFENDKMIINMNENILKGRKNKIDQIITTSHLVGCKRSYGD